MLYYLPSSLLILNPECPILQPQTQRLFADSKNLSRPVQKSL